MGKIVELDERGAIQLPGDLLAVVKPRTRYVLEMQGETIVLRPITALPFWQTATPQERAEAARQWAAFEHPAAPPIPDAALHREQITIREE
jgi:hypothetical protein